MKKTMAMAVAAMAAIGARAVEYHVKMDKPAAWTVDGWTYGSLPIGCGWFGTSEFGGTDVERLQISDPSFLVGTKEKIKYNSGFTDLADVEIELGHTNATSYVRKLVLDDSLLTVSYENDGVEYRREMFASYPDRAGAVHLTAGEKGRLDFVFRVKIPYVDETGERSNRTARVEYKDGGFEASVTSMKYGVCSALAFTLESDGKVETKEDSIEVTGADEATIYYSVTSNYRFDGKMFTKARKEYFGPDPLPAARENAAKAKAKGYAAMKAGHIADYRSLYDRSSFELEYAPEDLEAVTRDLRKEKGAESAYLAAVYWRLGKYLLISSSRKGTLPPNLQGCWSGPQLYTPWGAGYWHNVNIQMNYWASFPCGLADCFESYAVFNEVLRSRTFDGTKSFVRHVAPENAQGEWSPDAWSFNTSAYPYSVMPQPWGSHSGPGNSGFVSQLFIDWYDYTLDREALEKYVWPVLHGAGEFLSRAVVETNGVYLSKFSASPEQKRNGGGRYDYYHTTGCAFDQQMIEANNAALVRIAKTLGKEGDEVVERCKGQIGKYEPVIIGGSGQIKEYREENMYGEIGEKHHRHISQLVGLYPATIINRSTPEWFEAARTTLELRGDMATGWALAHRMCCWARLGDGDRVMKLFDNLLKKRSCDNLWDLCPPLQIDGNFGATAAITELLVQSQRMNEKGEFAVDLLPALPSAWRNGELKGFRARGGRSVSFKWRDGKVVEESVKIE